jgi:hypothetical protein
MACERHFDGRVLELAAANLDRRKIRSIGDEQRKTAGEEGKEEQEEEEEEGKREKEKEQVRGYVDISCVHRISRTNDRQLSRVPYDDSAYHLSTGQSGHLQFIYMGSS